MGAVAPGGYLGRGFVADSYCERVEVDVPGEGIGGVLGLLGLFCISDQRASFHAVLGGDHCQFSPLGEMRSHRNRPMSDIWGLPKRKVRKYG